MQRSSFHLALWGLLLPLVSAHGQQEQIEEKTTVLCDVADPENQCPGVDCFCAPDTIEITFDGASDSIFEYDSFVDGIGINATVVMDTKSEEIQGWSYGVLHDPGLIRVTRADIADTDAEATLDRGFNATTMENVQLCDSARPCANRTDGGGWISAVVLSLTKPVSLPLGRRSIARADYELLEDVGEAGTLLEFTDRLALRGAPPTGIGLTVNGRLRVWATAVEGWVKKKGEAIRVLCDVSDPQNQCPGTACLCTDDALEITFDGASDSIFEYGSFVDGIGIDATVVMDAKSEEIQGWSYGVRHDAGLVRVTRADIVGTDAEAVFDQGFEATSMKDIQLCDSVPACANRTDGAGWISAVVLNLRKPISLPLGRRSIARADYELIEDVGEAGTLLEFTDRLALRGAPHTGIALTVDGRTRYPTIGIDGLIRKSACPGLSDFRRGDVGASKAGQSLPADGEVNIGDALLILRQLFLDGELEFDCEKAADVNDSSEITISDAVALLGYLFLGYEEPAPPFGVPGPDPTPDALSCCRG